MGGLLSSIGEILAPKYVSDLSSIDCNREDIELQPPEAVQIATFLATRGTVLLDIIDVQYGLLDKLRDCGLLDQQQIELIIQENTSRGKVNRLLDEVLQLPHEQLEQFMTALDTTQQSHVTNYIRNKGQLTSIASSNWPVVVHSCWKKIEQNWSQLIEVIDTHCGLLDELLTVQCINTRQEQHIDTINVYAERNSLLLNILKRKSARVYATFIECMLTTKQYLVVSLLEPAAAPDGFQPLSEKENLNMQRNHSALVQLIDTKYCGLCDEMMSAECLTWRQREYIDRADSQSDANKRLLNFIKRGSLTGFRRFLHCLKRTGQQHLANVLTSDGVVAEIVAKTSLNNVGEAAVIDIFNSYRQMTSQQQQKELLYKLFQMVDVKPPIAMQTEHSIKLFFLCDSLAELRRLRKLYSMDKLKKTVQLVFSSLLNLSEASTVHKLVWNTVNYNHCSEYLTISRFRIQSLMHDPPSESKKNGSLSHMDRLPHEVIDIMLVKAAGHLFSVDAKMKSRADKNTLTTLGLVCYYWWETLTYRRSTRQLLQRYFTKTCHPYRYSPEQVAILEFGGFTRFARFVKGVAEVKSKFYVISQKSNTVKVFTLLNESVKHVRTIEVPGLKSPVDIVACNELSRLYVTDVDSRCIWLINLSPLERAKKVDTFAETQYEPWKLSIKHSRLLVTAYSGDALHCYNRDGQLIKGVQLPYYMNSSHAVETSNGTFIICHSSRWNKGKGPQYRTAVTELSAEGEVLRMYKGPTVLDESCYLIMDDHKHLLVADPVNERILHLNEELELKQVLLSKQQLSGPPSSFCYSNNSGRLYVCYLSSSSIDLFAVA